VYTLAYRILGNHAEAQEVVGDTFLSVHQGWADFTGHSAPFTWIYRIIERSFDETIHRDHHPEPALLEEIESPVERAFLRDALIHEIRTRCHGFMLYRLTPPQRVVFVLRLILDLDLDTIAAILELKKGVIKARLSRAKATLERHLHGKCQWRNAQNPCHCDTQLGYVLSRYPRLLEEVKAQANRAEYRTLIAQQSPLSPATLDALFARLPLREFHPGPPQK
jgi:RNA polymerase sigma-70 factor (ECF subfamily)